MADSYDVILEGDETEVLDVGVIEVDPMLKEDVWLLGKVLTSDRVPAGPFRMVMQRLWESRNYEEIRHVGVNLFSFRFKKTKDRDPVLKSGPWFFNHHLLALNSFDATVNPTEIPMTRVPFWVQVHGLSYPFRTVNVAKSLAKGFAGFLDWDRRRDGECLRLRVWVNIEAPLRKGQLVAGGAREPYKAIFKYEKLHDFCFRCGRLDHIAKDCRQVQVATNPPRFGVWLRATVASNGGAGFWLEEGKDGGTAVCA
ncbi:uncharacterized protein LOC130744664 [Lotus japonicus]|uniref:uncharacterized protein LOC130744664 n=1 Tax=Lotus japonicus TaxID=34305 RepID=UPI00258FB597|nr:uncharacterized protein LOC130744664 [Lotus japonicus]